VDDLDRLWERIEDLSDMPSDVRSHFDGLSHGFSQYLSGGTQSFQSINLFPFVWMYWRGSNSYRVTEIFDLGRGKDNLFCPHRPLVLQNVCGGSPQECSWKIHRMESDSVGVDQGMVKILRSIYGLTDWHYKEGSEA